MSDRPSEGVPCSSVCPECGAVYTGGVSEFRAPPAGLVCYGGAPNHEQARKTRRAELVKEFMIAALPANILWRDHNGQQMNEQECITATKMDAIRMADAFLAWEAEQ